MLRSASPHVNVAFAVVEELSQKRLVVVTGKGGVGKTTLAAAIAVQSARAGLRTLVCEVNTQERISVLLGKQPAGPEVTLIDKNLWAVDVRPQNALHEYALMRLKFESLYHAVFENRLVRYFLRFIPSLQEIVLLGKILFHVREKQADGSWRFDRIVVDAPATGHAIPFFSVPQVLLDTIPPGAMSDDARWMRDLLVDEQTTAVVLVSLPEELPVNETIELCEVLKTQVKMHPQMVVLNGFIPERFDGDDFKADLSPGLLQIATEHEARARLSTASQVRLETLGLRVVTVPRMFEADFGRESILKVADLLEGQR